MIRRFRVLTRRPTADMVEDLISSFTAGPTDDGGTDRSLEILVKNAAPKDTLDDSNASRIWRDLRKRMVGPFGKLAVEGPVRSPFDTGGPKGAAAPFLLADSLRNSPRDALQSCEPARDTIKISMMKLADGPHTLR
jgi:hypothetical protein